MELILLPLLRFAFGAISMVGGRRTRAISLLALLCDAALLTRIALLLAGGAQLEITLGGWADAVGIAFVGDLIGLPIAALIWGLAVAVTLYTWKGELRPYFFVLLHFLIGSAFAMVFTQDLFNAYVILELLTLTSFLLVGYERNPSQIWASLRYLILCSVGMSLFLLGIAVAYYHTGTLNVPRLAAHVAGNPSAPWIPLAAALLVGGVAVKAGIFFFSLWLPAAHSRAMPAVSALLSGVVIKMGVVELFRLAEVFPLDLTFTVLGVSTGLLGILYAIQTYDLKELLAFHTLSQIGYLLIGFGAESAASRLGALDYAIAHGLFKALLFLAVGQAVACVGSSDVRALKLERCSIPLATRIAIAVGMLGIVGIPPFAGFTAKAVLESGVHSILVRVMVGVISVGTAASFSKLLPLLPARSTATCERPTTAAYAWLGGAIALFLPLSATLVPRSILSATWQWPAYLEAGIAVMLGYGVHRLLRGRSLGLPKRLFRVEEGTVAIVAGVLIVFALLRFV